MSSTPQAVMQCQNILFDWAESIDTKSWSQLQTLFAPKISIDYKSIGGRQVSSIPSAAFVQVFSSPAQLGHPGVATQHLIGACRWLELSETRMQVKFQIRAAHWKVSDKDDGTGADHANGYGLNTMEFELREEGWKIVLIAVGVRWIEGDFKNIFKSKI
ncbi:NTF2-like protein [Penicillium sp. IBT 16267x]|nr:NTF2-like protein [Penicillium sp. IBT 16267x]